MKTMLTLILILTLAGSAVATHDGSVPMFSKEEMQEFAEDNLRKGRESSIARKAYEAERDAKWAARGAYWIALWRRLIGSPSGDDTADTPKAAYDRGLMYAKGQGVPLDDKEAVKWYRKAADQGYVYAQLHLGFMYISGGGGEGVVGKKRLNSLHGISGTFHLINAR